MRDLPPDVAAQILPMPVDFSPVMVSEPKRVIWRRVVQISGDDVHLELGFRKPVDASQNRAAGNVLKADAWQALELARLGQVDLLRYATTDRHATHTVSPPLWTPPPEEPAAS